MEKKIASLFFLRKDKQVKNELLPIYLRVTIGGERFVWSTQRYVQPDKWSASASKVKGGSEEAKTINAYLDLIKHKIFTYQKELILEHKELTIVSFKAKWLGNSDNNKFLLEVFAEHNRQMAKLIEKEEYAQGTLTHFETTLKHTKAFIKLKFGLTDMQINKVDYAFLSDFEFYLKSEICAHNTTIKYLGDLKKIVLICVKRNWLERDPFVGYDMSRRDVEREFLVDHELQMLSDKRFQSERLMLVKDIFLFSCFTGLAYADVKKLKRSEIRVGIDGKKWLFIQRQKTDTPSPVPLLPVALNIIEKYKEHPKSSNGDTVLPILSNQKMNAYLKEIADICGIAKELTYHTARHTFATTVTLNNNVPIESVSKMMGHKNLKTTQHYAKILNKKVSDDMELLAKKLHQQLPVSNQITI